MTRIVGPLSCHGPGWFVRVSGFTVASGESEASLHRDTMMPGPPVYPGDEWTDARRRAGLKSAEFFKELSAVTCAASNHWIRGQ